MICNEIKFINVGNIREQNIILKPFTVFVGRNNTGKTLLTNALFFLHTKHMKTLILRFINESLAEATGATTFVKAKNLIQIVFKKLNAYPFYNDIYKNDKFNDSYITFKYKQFDNLQNEFNLFDAINKFFVHNPIVLKLLKNAAELKGQKFPILTKQGSISERNDQLIKFLEIIFETDLETAGIIAQSIFEDFFCTNKDIYIFPVERAGINTFLFDVTREINESNISLENYLSLINNLKNIPDDYKSAYYEIACKLEYDLFKGKIELRPDPQNKQGKRLVFTDSNNTQVDSSLFSSSINELSTFILYLKYKAKKGDLVFIDEPEISLHPDAQRILVRYLTLLNNLDIKLVLITHSDYIVKELSHTISLGIKKEIQQNAGEVDFFKELSENSLDEYIINVSGENHFAALEKESILYSLDQDENSMETIIEVLIPTSLGYNEKIFNESINKTNFSSNKIATYITMEDADDVSLDKL